MILADCIPDSSKNRNRNRNKQNFLFGLIFLHFIVLLLTFYCMEYDSTTLLEEKIVMAVIGVLKHYLAALYLRLDRFV